MKKSSTKPAGTKPAKSSSQSAKSQTQSTKKSAPKRTSKEKIVENTSYGLYFFGQNIFYTLLATFLLTFFTDIGIPAAMVAIIMLVTKIWDAVIDPVFGGIVDKVNLKGGKFVPWLRISLVLIPLFTIIMFAIPAGDAIPLPVKFVWALVSNLLWGVAYTMCDIPIFGLVTVVTDDQNERTTMMSVGRLFSQIGTMVVYVAIPAVRTAFGGWFPTVFALSIIALVFMSPLCFTAKERIKARSNEANVTIKMMFQYVVSNKYLLYYYGANIITGALGISAGLHLLVARIILGDENQMIILAVLQIVPALIAGAIVPFIAKKIDKYYIFIFCTILSIIFRVIIYLVGFQSLPLLYVLSGISGIPAGFCTIISFMFTPDCAEYGQYKSGYSASGITFACQTFSAKMISAIGTAAGALALSLIGFVEGEGAVQAANFNQALWGIYFLVPVLGSIISLPLLYKYKLRDKYVSIMVKANTGEISHAEAEKLLKGANL
jgi:probable glucitol transport protein GutA